MLDSAYDNPNATMTCNPLLIKQLREQCGFTQAELAKQAGYSERLIVKAESGRSISVRTIQDIATALSTSEHPIHLEDLVTDPVLLARKFMAALYIQQKNAITAIRHFLDPEVVFYINGDPERIPFAGVHHGIEAVDRAYHLLFSVLEVPAEHDHSDCFCYIAQGTDVMIWGESWIHPIGQPLDKPMPLSQLLRFRKGKLYYFEDHYDTLRTADIIEPVREQQQKNTDDDQL